MFRDIFPLFNIYDGNKFKRLKYDELPVSCGVMYRKNKLIRVEKWFQKYGDKAVLFGRMIPVFREMISIPAGLLKMKFKKFLAYTILGSCGWSITLVFAGYYFGVAALELW